MSGFSYKLNIGKSYTNDEVVVDITLELKDGLSNEDYATVRESLNTIEDICRSYIPVEIESKEEK